MNSAIGPGAERPSGDERDAGDTQTLGTIAPARAIAETLSTTLGPNGLDKMVIDRSGTVIVTNTGATVLDGLAVDAPTGRVVRNAVRTQARRIGDGTTTTALLIGELLGRAERLVAQGLHPTSIVDGYLLAAECAEETLRQLAVPVDSGDDTTLRAVASTAVTGRWDASATEQFADLTLSALRSVNFDATTLTLHAYPGGELSDSERIDGILIDADSSSTSLDRPETPIGQVLRSPTLALVGDEIQPIGAKAAGTVVVRDADGLAAVHGHEREATNDIHRTVVGLGVDVLACHRSIDDAVRTELARAGVLSIERTRRDEFDALARATNASVVHDVSDLDADSLGSAGTVRRRRIGPSNVLTATGLPAESHTSVVLRGGTPHVAEETRRIVDEGIAVVRHAAQRGGVVPGGGAGMIAVSRAVESRAAGVGDRSALAVEAFADAVTEIPRTLASNAGADPIDALAAIRERHHGGEPGVGVSRSGSPRDMLDVGVLEPVTVPINCLATAVETAVLLLRIDDVLDADGTEDHGGHEHERDAHGHSHGHESEQDGHGGYPWALSH